MNNYHQIISIIIPIYNSGQFLTECIESVLNQTYTQIEILIVNNNSVDNSLKIIEEYMSKHKHIILLHENKQGAAIARNTGLKHAKGEWIQFLDSDDILLPNKLEQQIDLIKKNEDIGLLMSSYLFRDIDGLEEVFRVRKDPFVSLLDNKGYGQTSANLWRRSDLLKVGGFNESQRVYNDPELIFRMIESGVKILYDDRANSIYRNINPQSLTKNLGPKDLLDGYNLSRRIFKYAINNLNPRGKYLTQLSNLLLKRIRMLAERDLDQAAIAFRNHKEIISNLSSVKADFGPDKYYLTILKIFGVRMAELATRLKRKIL